MGNCDSHQVVFLIWAWNHFLLGTCKWTNPRTLDDVQFDEVIIKNAEGDILDVNQLNIIQEWKTN